MLLSPSFSTSSTWAHAGVSANPGAGVPDADRLSPTPAGAIAQSPDVGGPRLPSPADA